MDTGLITRFVAALEATPSTEAARSVVDDYAGARGRAASEFLNELAISVGEGFASGGIGFDEAMGTMAGIYNALFPSDLLIAKDGESLAYRLYWALDEGEYRVESDGNTDPIEARALPAVRRVLAEASPPSRAQRQ
ncbi:hypothetical protein V4F39_15610 [Aquincola sp. MAHUQ-54]|uniref:Uncharacterized protein n=1 Tax=Aquincola agrisoli TaxID=3119538 RepID=A0AAW9QDU9_9BURK